MRSILGEALTSFVRVLPRGVVRWLGALQFRIPVLGPLIRRVGAVATHGVHPIAGGVGKGLMFDNRGGFPGYALGTTEPEEQEALVRVVSPGAVVFNVGANIGFHAVLCGRLVGESGRVVAFEPFPESAAQAARNLALNGFQKRSEVVEVALSDTPGRARFALQGASAQHALMAADSPGVEVPVMEVEMTTLDSFVSERTVRPNVILIDVEGAEVRVLEGGRETIRSARPTLLVEVHWLQDSVRGFYERELVPLGYTALDLNWEPYRFQGEPRRDHVVLIPGSARSE